MEVASDQRATYIFLWKGYENHELGISFTVHKRIVSAVKRVESVSETMSYIAKTKRSLM
jgi:hypothetical protein